MDNSRYLLRRFYDSFAVSFASHHRSLLVIRVSGVSASPFAQRRTRQKDKIETKRDRSNSIPNKISLTSGTRQTPRKSAASTKFRQIGNHDSHQIKFENAWSSTRSRNMLLGFSDFVKQRFAATFVFYILRYD